MQIKIWFYKNKFYLQKLKIYKNKFKIYNNIKLKTLNVLNKFKANYLTKNRMKT